MTRRCNDGCGSRLVKFMGTGGQDRASLARDQRLTFSRERVPRFVRSRGITNTPIGKTVHLKSLRVTPKDFFWEKRTVPNRARCWEMDKFCGKDEPGRDELRLRVLTPPRNSRVDGLILPHVDRNSNESSFSLRLGRRRPSGRSPVFPLARLATFSISVISRGLSS